MSNEERPLPKPPTTPFGRKKFTGGDDDSPLMADRIAAAMAEGRMEEFLKNEVPDNEHARALVTMMMGMTGMMPPEGLPVDRQSPDKDVVAPAESVSPVVAPVPEDVINAVQGADIEVLKQLLMQEHQKRTGSVAPLPQQEAPKGQVGLSAGEKEVMDRLIRIASDNQVTVDWLILRALKLYVDDFQKTGRL